MALDSTTVPNARVVILDKYDTSGSPYIAAIHQKDNKVDIEVNKLSSIYEKNNINDFIKDTVEKGGKIYQNEKTNDWLSFNRLQLPEEKTSSLIYADNIPQNNKNVNSGISNNMQQSNENIHSNKINETINTAQEYIDKPFNRNNQPIQNNIINDYNNQIKQEVENKDLINSTNTLYLGKNIDNKKEISYNSQNGKGDYYEQSFKSGDSNENQGNGARRFGTEENNFNNEFVRKGDGETNEESVARIDDRNSFQGFENRPRTYELRENNNGQQQTKTVNFTKDKINELANNYSENKPTQL